MAKTPIDLKEVSDQDMIKSLYFSQGLLLLSSLVLGLIFFRHIDQLTKHFIFNGTWVYGAIFGIVVVITDITLMRFLPKQFYDDGGINERMFKALSVPHIFLSMCVVAFSEELLFRGILQTLFGLWISSLCFALVHIRYLKKPLLLSSVIILSFLLGLLFQYTGNLIATIVSHYVIDLCLGLILKRELMLKGDVADDYK